MKKETKENLEQIAKKETGRRWYHPKNYSGALIGAAYGWAAGYVAYKNFSFFRVDNYSLIEKILFKPVIELFTNVPPLNKITEFVLKTFYCDITWTRMDYEKAATLTGIVLLAPVGFGIEKGIKYCARKYQNRKLNLSSKKEGPANKNGI